MHRPFSISAVSFTIAKDFFLTDAGTVVSRQLEPGLTLTGEGTGDIHAAMLAVPVPALINV